jgi:hypothetical protein
VQATFISLRRAALERFINRVGFHPVLRQHQPAPPKIISVEFSEAATYKKRKKV